MKLEYPQILIFYLRRRNILESFNGFYLPQSKVEHEGRSKRNVLDSFTSFYLNNKVHPIAEARNKREAESDLEKRNGLDSFTSFYLPKLSNADHGDRGKRDVLEPFTSFYMAKSAAKESNRNKRENQGEETEG